jgi:hypothetical protein
VRPLRVDHGSLDQKNSLLVLLIEFIKDFGYKYHLELKIFMNNFPTKIFSNICKSFLKRTKCSAHQGLHFEYAECLMAFLR